MLSPQFQAYHERSLVSSTSWAIGAHHHFFGDPSSPGGPLEPARFRGVVQSGERLAGGSFPDGRLYDPITGQFSSLMAARDIAARRTLHETHVNLETGIGQWLKGMMQLPFQEHSRLDPMKAAVQAEATFSEGVLDRFARSERNGVLQFAGADRIGPDGLGAMEGRIPAYLTELELHAHGGGRLWGVSALDAETVPTQQFFDAAVQQEKVSSVLLTACNAEHAYLSVPEGVTAIHGLGRGYHRSPIHADLEAMGHGGFYSWRDAIVLHEGSTAQIIPKNALEAQMGRTLTGTGPVAPAADEGTIGLFRPAAGEVRVGFWPNETGTVPLSQAPVVTRTVGPDGAARYFLPTGEEQESLEAATRTLVSRFRPATQDLWGDAMPAGMAESLEVRLGPARGGMVAEPAASDWFEREGARLSQVFQEVTESAAQSRKVLGDLKQAAAGGPLRGTRAAAAAGELFTESAAARAAPAAGAAAEHRFTAPGWAGIILGGALIAGGLFMLRPDKQHARVPRARPHTGEIAGPPGAPEGQTESTRTVGGRQPHEKFSTQVTLHDAAPDWGYLDRLYSEHL